MNHYQNSNIIDQSSDQIDNGLPPTLSPEDDIFEQYEEYVLANPSEEPNQIAPPTSIPQPRGTRHVIQDECDEDNYTLARPSDDSNNTIKSVLQKDGRQLARCSMTKHTKMIFLICVLVVISVSGGIIAYIALGKQGNELIY